MAIRSNKTGSIILLVVIGVGFVIMFALYGTRMFTAFF